MNFLRMGVSTYNDLLQTVTPFTEKEDTAIINAIPLAKDFLQLHAFWLLDRHLKI
jgi:hypothetical protein